MKRLAIHTALALGVVALALLVWQMRESLEIFALAIVIAAALEPLTHIPRLHRVPRWLMVGATYFVASAAMIGGALLLGALLPAELRRIADGAQRSIASVRASWPTLLPALPASLDALGDHLGAQLLAGSSTLFALLLDLCLALVLSLCWALGQEAIQRTFVAMLPRPERRRAHEVWRATLTAVGAQLRAEVAQSVSALVLLGPLFYTIGVPYPVVAAFLVAVLRVVPLFGAGAATFAAFICASGAPLPRAILAGATTLVMLAVLANFLARRRQPTRLVDALVMISLFEILGPLGLLLSSVVAAPLFAIGTTLGETSLKEVDPECVSVSPRSSASPAPPGPIRPTHV